MAIGVLHSDPFYRKTRSYDAISLSDNRKELMRKEKGTFLDIVDHSCEEKERRGRSEKEKSVKRGNHFSLFGKKSQVKKRIFDDNQMRRFIHFWLTQK